MINEFVENSSILSRVREISRNKLDRLMPGIGSRTIGKEGKKVAVGVKIVREKRGRGGTLGCGVSRVAFNKLYANLR